jgi:hypothetical protein
MTENTDTNRKLSPRVIFFVFFSVAILHFTIHCFLPNYIFDDTRHISAGYEASQDAAPKLHFQDVKNIAYNEFTNSSTREYRPFSFIQSQLIISKYAHDYMSRPWIPTVIIALGFGLMAAMHCLFAFGLLRSTKWSILATFIFITNMPVLTGAWIVAMGWQWVVNLSILAGLLCYQRYKKLSQTRFLLLFTAIAIIGTWFREYSGLFVFITLINEMFFERKRSWTFIIVALACAFHVIFPAFLANIIFWGKLAPIALTPVYKLGPISQLSQGGSHLFDLSQLRWDAFYHLIALFSPLLWIIGLFSICTKKFDYKSIFILSKTITTGFIAVMQKIRITKIYPIFLSLCFLISSWGIIHYDFSSIYIITTLTFYLLIATYILPKSPVLFLYALFSFLPFLKIYLHEVHLAYAVAPMSIVLIYLLKQASNFVTNNSGNIFSKKWFGYILVLIIGIVIADSLCNVIANYKALNGIYDGIENRATWLKKNTPKNSIVVSNFIDLRDMTLYAPNHFQPYFSLANWEKNQVNTGSKFIAMFEEKSPQTSIYLLGAVFPRLANKYNYHHLHYLAILQDSSPQHYLFSTRVVYPYFDPFKYFLPNELTSYPGPPDLVDDYKVVKERSGVPFIREIFADYLLLKITSMSDTEKAALLESRNNDLVEYRGFNIFKASEKETTLDDKTGLPIVKSEYVALSQSYGPMRLEDLNSDANFKKCQKKGQCFFASSIEKIKESINSM